jgi:phage terminase small subunit
MADGGLGARGLTEQQRRFADLILTGKTQIEAHKQAGYKGRNDNARGASASEILRNPNVAAYLAERQAGAAARAELTAAHFAKRLERIASAAERAAFGNGLQDRDDAEAILASRDILAVTPKEAAEIARAHSMDAAKLLGLVVEKRENTNRDVNDTSELSREELLDIARTGGKGAAAQANGAGKPDRVHAVH